MEKLVKTITFILFPMFLVFQESYAQELFEINNASIDEELIVPSYQFEYIPDFTYKEIEERVKAMNTEMSFVLNDRIFSFINYFTVRNREYTKMVLQRKDTYFPLFEETLAHYEMPDDIKFLAIIESGLNPKAKSRVGAMGLWQFMPATGRMYNLHVNYDIDDRMDPELATEAAAKYLKSLYRMFGNWELALAAYNCGPGNVRKAIRRSGGKTTFWEIYNYLPRETRGYVPQFQAMMYIFHHAEYHNFILEEPSYPLAYEKIMFNQALDLEQLAALSGICIQDLEELNPSIKNRLLPTTHQHHAIRIPKAKSDFIVSNKENFSDAVKLTTERTAELRLASNQSNSGSAPIPSVGVGDRISYKVKPGDVLGKIAQSHGTSVQNLKAWNNLSSNLIKVGQTLYIYSGKVNTSTSLAQNQSPANLSPDGKYYTVQPGDSLWLISKKINGLTVEQIKQMNNLNSNQIKPGQKLIIG
jgi:membrane-bound lytic murein transglycosylase D